MSLSKYWPCGQGQGVELGHAKDMIRINEDWVIIISLLLWQLPTGVTYWLKPLQVVQLLDVLAMQVAQEEAQPKFTIQLVVKNLDINFDRKNQEVKIFPQHMINISTHDK